MVLTRSPKHHRPPSRLLWAAELPRALWMAATKGRWRGKLAAAPRGDGRPVLLLPGLINRGEALLVLHRYLGDLGYHVEEWGLGLNLGARTVGPEGERLIARVEAMAATEGQPVSLVGVSLGGMLARFVAGRRPDLVREVVTIASPYNGPGRATNVWRAYERFTGDRIDDPVSLARSAEIARPLPVPATAIWSRSDGLVQGLICRDPSARCVEVRASHLWVQHRPAVLLAVAEALGRPSPPTGSGKA